MKTYGIDGAAEFLNISPDTLRDLAADGTIAGAKIGKSWVFADEDLAEYLREEVRKQTLARREAASPANIKSVEEKRYIKRRACTPPPLGVSSW